MKLGILTVIMLAFGFANSACDAQRESNLVASSAQELAVPAEALLNVSATTVSTPSGEFTAPVFGACSPGGSGICPPGKGCQCGEEFCTSVNQPCP